MMNSLIQRTTTPQKGLFPIEKAVLAYLLFTLIVMVCMRHMLYSAPQMLLLRGEVVLAMAVGYIIYKVYPCDATAFLRVGIQMLFLAALYSDTYEFNRCFANLDHLFCTAEQTLFGCQPALVMSQHMPGHIVSELLDLSYAAFYPIIAATVLFYLFCRGKALQKAAYIITATFLLYFIIFDFLPVAGPTFYFRAVGVDVIEQGVFPSIGHYFSTHYNLSLDSLPSPGWHDGVMWQIVELAKHTGERPTAAFPSSHIGISIVCLILLWQTKNKTIFWSIVPFVVLMLAATVYIQAHYAIDVLAGLLSGVIIYFLAAGSYTLITLKNKTLT